LEPSPLGDLSLAAATTTVMQNSSLDATLDARTGGDGRPYGIGFAIALPSD
jgi:hypothetical protein